MGEPRYAVGIDLGTTHCAISAARIDHPKVHLLQVPQLVAPGEGLGGRAAHRGDDAGVRPAVVIGSLDVDHRLGDQARQVKAQARQALRRELARDGQAFVLHNRVETIERAAKEIRELIPEARVVIGHGQMVRGLTGEHAELGLFIGFHRSVSIQMVR